MELKLPGYIDSSMLSTWRACKRKFFWSYLNALYPAGKSVHLIAGGAFAAGMEAARRLAFSGTKDHRPILDDLLQVAMPAFIREWGDYIPPENSAKSFENTFQGLAEYLKNYPPLEDPIQPHIKADGTPAVEYTFSIPLPISHPETKEPFLFVGRFDMLGEWNGLPCIVDEKTTEAMGDFWQQQFYLRGQFMAYCWACQQHGMQVNTAVVNGIAIQKTQYKFQRVIVQFPQHLIDRWYYQMIQDVHDICVAYDECGQWKDEANIYESREQNFPYNFADACSSYGGCAFVPLCSAKDATPYFSNYIRHVWDPLKKQPVKELENAT